MIWFKCIIAHNLLVWILSKMPKKKYGLVFEIQNGDGLFLFWLVFKTQNVGRGNWRAFEIVLFFAGWWRGRAGLLLEAGGVVEGRALDGEWGRRVTARICPRERKGGVLNCDYLTSAR